MAVLGTNPTQHITVISTTDWTTVLPFPAEVTSSPFNTKCYEARQRLLEKQIGNAVDFDVELEAKGQWCAVTQDLEGVHWRGPLAPQFRLVLRKNSQLIDEEPVTLS